MCTVEKMTEEMRSLARSSYSEAGYVLSGSSRPTGSPTARVNSRKRIKDTSGQGTSPNSTQARPVAKRALGTLGRRLTYSTLGNSYIAQNAYNKFVCLGTCSGSEPLTDRANVRALHHVCLQQVGEN